MHRFATALVALVLTGVASGCVVHTRLIHFADHPLFAGQLVNTGDQAMRNQHVDVMLLDLDEWVLGQQVEACLRSTPAGGSNFFEAALSSVPLDWFGTRAEVSGGTSVTLSDADTPLRVSNLMHREQARISVRARVVNEGDYVVSDVRACIVVRDLEDGVLRVGQQDLGDIAPHGTVSTTASLAIPYAQGLRVETWVDGFEQASLLAPVQSNVVTSRRPQTITGIEPVDQVLTRIFPGDPAAIEPLLEYQTIHCPIGIAPPSGAACGPGDGGTDIVGITFGSCEGGFVERDNIGELLEVLSGQAHLLAVYRTETSPGSFAAVYGSVFNEFGVPNGNSSVEVRIKDGKIVMLSRSCGTPDPSQFLRGDLEYVLPPITLAQ